MRGNMHRSYIIYNFVSFQSFIDNRVGVGWNFFFFFPVSVPVRTHYKLKEHIREQPSVRKAQNGTEICILFLFLFLVASPARGTSRNGSKKLRYYVMTVSLRLSKTEHATIFLGTSKDATGEKRMEK